MPPRWSFFFFGLNAEILLREGLSNKPWSSRQICFPISITINNEIINKKVLIIKPTIIGKYKNNLKIAQHMEFRTLDDFDLKDKRVVLRADFNVPLDEKQEITDDNRIVQALPTIKKNPAEGCKAAHYYVTPGQAKGEKSC